jgi:hypothetical protein
MARKIQVVLEDDLSGGPADETITFALDGVSYEIDLSDANAAQLRDALRPYVAAARRSGGRARRGSGATGGAGGEAAKIRAWAEANGIAVSARGRIPADVREKYEATHL